MVGLFPYLPLVEGEVYASRDKQMPVEQDFPEQVLKVHPWLIPSS